MEQKLQVTPTAPAMDENEEGRQEPDEAGGAGHASTVARSDDTQGEKKQPAAGSARVVKEVKP